MDIPLIAARAVQFAGAISLAGLFGFAGFVAGPASSSLRRKLVALGWSSAALALFAALGTMVPAAHEALRWPIAYRLSLAALAAPSLRLQILATGGLAALGLIVLIAGIWQRKVWAVIIGAALVFGLGWRPIQLLAVAATPTNYAVSSEPFAVPSIADGAARPDGDLFWSLTVGMDGGISVVTITNAPDIRGFYALYEYSPQLEDAPPARVEFLIDRDGYIRARWRPGDTPDWTRLPALEREVAAMKRMKLRPVVPTGHVHEG